MAKPELRIVLQTGPFTPPDSLVLDLEATSDIQIDQRRLGASFRGGGGAAFIVVTTAADNIATLADILHRHTKRLKEKGGDNLFLLSGARINTDEEVIGFRDVQCQKQVSLKGKSQGEIGEILEEDAGG
ncbi:MAG: hypothetical protein E3J65_05310 [Dehalococcoidia bacterium]|nr:MAG: hypothetical protein E3J65_05310 [Dehalococcoidia bacterium]